MLEAINYLQINAEVENEKKLKEPEIKKILNIEKA